MPTHLKTAVMNYLRASNLARGTRKGYLATLRKWTAWGGEVPIEELSRQEIRDFLDWVHEQAANKGQTNPGRTANKSRENLRAVMAWAWEWAVPLQQPRRIPKQPRNRPRWF